MSKNPEMDTTTVTTQGQTRMDEKEPVEVLEDQVKAIFTAGLIEFMAVEEPPKRRQAHDDDRPVVVRPYLIATPFALCDPATWHGRGKLIGAVIKHQEEVWILVNPTRVRDADFLDRLCQAAREAGPEGYVVFWTGLTPEVRKNWKEPSKAFPKYFGKKE